MAGTAWQCARLSRRRGSTESSGEGGEGPDVRTSQPARPVLFPAATREVLSIRSGPRVCRSRRSRLRWGSLGSKGAQGRGPCIGRLRGWAFEGRRPNDSEAEMHTSGIASPRLVLREAPRQRRIEVCRTRIRAEEMTNTGLTVQGTTCRALAVDDVAVVTVMVVLVSPFALISM